MPSINTVQTYQIVADSGDVVATVEFNPVRPYGRGHFDVRLFDPERQLKMDEIATLKQALDFAANGARKIYQERPDFRASEDSTETSPKAEKSE